jgi:microcystin-dependent protein
LPGDVVLYNSKHYSCLTKNRDSSFIPTKWEESYVHMEEGYNAGDYWKNSQPTIIFDNDTDGTDSSITCGYNLGTVWSSDVAVQRQYRAASDYKGVHSFLVSIGFSSSDAHTILLPKASSDRQRDPSSALDGIAPPNGAANAWVNWAIEFRRPSNIRLFGHAWEWSGFLNYTKAIPSYQKELSSQNKFTYYLTNKDGGRVYGSGFNEEGYVVTPQGLQDITTGEQVSVENIADVNVPIDEITFPTFYDELTVNTLKVNNSANVAGPLTGSTITTSGNIKTDAEFQGNGTIPVGGIIMWSGAISNMPSGWALCNGANGTPDLRGRFIVGASNDSGSDTSLTITTITTSDTITFSTNHNLPVGSRIKTGSNVTGTGLTANTAYYVTSVPAANQVKVSTTYGGPNAVLTNGSSLGIVVTVIGVTFNPETGAVSGFYRPGDAGGEVAHQLSLGEMPSHSHSVTAVPGGQSSVGGGGAISSLAAPITSSSQGGNYYHENRPPYYALAFIMRMV